MWCVSTTSAAPPGSTSKKANTPAARHFCHIISSATTRVQLQLHAVAYNLVAFLRCIDLREAGRLVVGQPVIGADQDRRSGRAPCPSHHLPTCRGCGDRPDGVCHPCRDPKLASAAVMRVTATQTQTERMQQDRSVRRAGKCCLLTRMRSLICPCSGFLTHADSAPGRKALDQRAKSGHFANKMADNFVNVGPTLPFTMCLARSGLAIKCLSRWLCI